MAAVQIAPDTPLKDQQKFLRLIEATFASAAKKAAKKNDNLGIPTPVGVKGSVRYILNKNHFGERPVIVPDFLKKGYDANKRMWIVGGPNGAGKTTFVGEFLNILGHTNLVKLNADERTRDIRLVNPEMSLPEANLLAAQQIDAEVVGNIKTSRSILVETVLSSDKYQDDVLKAKAKGYKIVFVYVSLCPPELSPARVKVRVKKGGHDVDAEKAIDRHRRSHEQAAWFARQADAFIAFDNSAIDRKPLLVAAKLMGEELVHKRANVNPYLDKVIFAAKNASDAPTFG